ncbi:hypothetical protein IWW38_005945 [Coemansia aciculifera]|uniref:Uncharacterized protein n=1 Tax=Coemansia aciculifera TaxID=417176 RepID=A0ACC1LUN7_9FUNG|nr:hypothetical protein IWW38_005945 [Coemansia aciculifera]
MHHQKQQPPPPPPPPHTAADAAAAAAAAQSFALSSFDLHNMLPPHSAPIQQSQGQHPIYLTNSNSVSITPATSPPPMFAQQNHHPLSSRTSVSSAYNPPPFFPQAVMGLKHQLPAWEDTHSSSPMGRPRSASPVSGYDSAIDGAAAAGTPV